MKKTISILMTLFMLTLLCVPALAADYKCTLVPSDTSVKAGDTVNIDVEISEGFSGINVIINYDIDKFELVESVISEKMMVIANTDTQGKINLVAVSENVQPAQKIFSFRLRVLADGGKITMKVKEALAEGTADISGSVAYNEISIKAKGTAERLTPITTAAPTVTEQNSSQNEQNSSGNGESVSATGESGEPVTEIVSNSPTAEPETQIDADGDTVTDEEFQRESNIGLVVALCVGVAALAGAIAIILKKRADGKAQDVDSSAEK